MAILDDRENAFENKFAHDEELRFRTIAKRNKLLGLWAAELLGKRGAEADAYAAQVVAVNFEHERHEDVFEKIRTDFDAAGLDWSDSEIRLQMVELLAVASEQVLKT
ncbi:MAG TPA: DUF1476 domain-containing protein [Pararhizobium sp.]|nr:DUF1476 domain-containing protein [Pararhizobium sp.]